MQIPKVICFIGFHVWNVVILMKPSFVPSLQVLSCTELFRFKIY